MIKKNILVINEGFSNNLGDQAINKSFAYILKNIFKNNYFFEDLNRKTIDNYYQEKSINFNKPSVIKTWLYRLVWFFSNFSRINNAIKGKDCAFIGGGQLLLPNNIFPYVIFIWSFFLTIHKIPYYFFSVGTQGEYNFFSKWFLNFSLNNAKAIYVRDDLSKFILEKTFGVKSKLTFDIAFFLNKNYRENTTYPSNIILIGPISFQVISSYSSRFKNRNDYYEYWCNILLKNKSKNVKLFYSTNEDRNECILLQSHIKKNYFLEIELVENKSLNDFIKNIKSCEKLISGRMHSLILAKTFNKKYQTFFSSDKLKEFEKIYRHIDLSEVQNKIKKDLKYILNELN